MHKHTRGVKDRIPVPRTLAGAAAVLAAAVAMAGCGGQAPVAQAAPTTPAPTPGTTSTSSLSPASAAVLDAWESGEQTLYAYMQAPWQQERADLVAGETSGDLWPRLTLYFTGPALESENVFLLGLKMEELTGPSTYDLSHATVSAISTTTATVTGCIYDTGTTTGDGKPGPVSLDGGVGGGRGSWNLDSVDGSWKIASFETTSVPRC